MNTTLYHIYRMTILFMAFLPLCTHAQMPWNTEATYPKYETRAVWVTTLFGLDWPKTKATDEEGRKRQKEELRQLLDRLQAARINTVLLQTRVRGSVIYPSAIEPWDVCLTGQYDRDPGYDPLAFAIEEAHKRGMELHAWVVSVPAFKQEVARRMGRRSLLKTHPELLKKHEGTYYLDPALPQSAGYLASICREIASNYDVDGIHLDYIRYPENAQRFPDAQNHKRMGKGQSKANWRRENINRMVKAVHEAVRTAKPWVKLSSSPVGKYRDTRRQSSKGWNCYDAVFQDAKLWLNKGWQDMLFPMMYFTDQHFFPFVADWQESTGSKPVIPGLGIYFLSPGEKDWPLQTISTQLNVLRQQGMGGQAFFRSRFLTDDTKGIYTLLQQSFYAHPALPPPTPWLDSIAPSAPTAPIYKMENGLCHATWQPSADDMPQGGVTYNIYAGRRWPVDVSDARNIVVTHLQQPTFAYNPLTGLHLAVTAIDRCGNESLPLQLNEPEETVSQPAHHITVQNGHIPLPTDTVAPYYMITDLSGREVQTGRWQTTADVSRLAPGIYRLHTLHKGGVARMIGRFRK